MNTAMMEGAATGLSAVSDLLTTVMNAVTTVSANPLVAAAIAVPLTGSVIILVRKLFKRA